MIHVNALATGTALRAAIPITNSNGKLITSEVVTRRWRCRSGRIILVGELLNA